MEWCVISPAPREVISNIPAAQIKAPQITTFRLAPGQFNPLGLYAMLAYLSYPNYSASPLMTPSRVINDFVGGWSTVRYGVAALVIIHVLEGLYVTSLCRKSRTGFRVGVSLLMLPGRRGLMLLHI